MYCCCCCCCSYCKPNTEKNSLAPPTGPTTVSRWKTIFCRILLLYRVIGEKKRKKLPGGRGGAGGVFDVKIRQEYSPWPRSDSKLKISVFCLRKQKKKTWFFSSNWAVCLVNRIGHTRQIWKSRWKAHWIYSKKTYEFEYCAQARGHNWTMSNIWKKKFRF